MDCLKYLSVDIRCWESVTVCRDLYNSSVWNEMDHVFSSMSMLEQVVIHLHCQQYGTIPSLAHVMDGVRASMPRLDERKILTFKSNDDT
jgi:hypothetical protein